jgi:urease accessory protein
VTVLVEAILGHGDDPRFAGRRREHLDVGSEEAARRRLRRATREGTDVAIDLPRGSFLRQGAVLDDDGERVILVARRREPALVIRLDPSLPASELVEQAARIGHWAGNQHLLVEASGHELCVRVATTPELMLESARELDLAGAEVTTGDVAFALDEPPARGHAHA